MRTYTILLLAGCSLFATLNAQTTKKKQVAVKKDTLVQNNPVFDKDYTPTIQPAEKIEISPELEKFNIDKQPLSFSITESPTTITGDYIPLPPAGIHITFPAGDQYGYLRLGVGSHRSFVGDAQFNLYKKSNQSLDVNFMHRSVFGNLTNTADETKSAYSNKNNLVASYKLFTPTNEIEASLSEKYNAWNYYGTWRTEALPTDAWAVPAGQWSSDSKFGFGIKSKEIGQVFSWAIHADGHLFRLGRGVDAANLSGKEIGGREKEFDLKAKLDYDLSELFHLGLRAGMRSFSYRAPISWPMNETQTQAGVDKAFADRQWIEFTPYGRMTYKKWELTAGLKLAIPSLETDWVRPNIIASATKYLNEKTSFLLKLDGGVQPLSYREGFDRNPYLDPALRLKSAWKVIDLTGQLDYRPFPSLRLSPVVGYDATKDMACFFNGYPTDEGVKGAYGSIFDVKYMNSNRFHAGLSSLYTFNSFFTFLGEINYNHYLNFSSTQSVDDFLKANGRKAWYRPGVEMHFRADLSLINDLNLFFDYRIEGSRYAADNSSFCKKLEDINDLSLGGNFKLTKDVGVFLHVNNLLDQRDEIWNAYAVHGFTAVLGGSVKF